MKPRKNLSFAEERELAHEVQLHLSTATKKLMAKYGVSRTVVSRITRECKVYLQAKQNDAKIEGACTASTPSS